MWIILHVWPGKKEHRFRRNRGNGMRHDACITVLLRTHAVLHVNATPTKITQFQINECQIHNYFSNKFAPAHGLFARISRTWMKQTVTIDNMTTTWCQRRGVVSMSL